MNPQIENYHSILANYFSSKPLYLDVPTQKKPNIRKLVELPWQQTKAKMWDEVTDTICNLDFIQAKAASKMTYELVTDFNVVLEVIPDNAEDIRQEKVRQARMNKYTQDLVACAKGEITIDELEIPESITPWTEKQIDAEIERIKINPTGADRLKDFFIYIRQEAGNLQEYSDEFENFSYQQAWNYSNSGPVGKATEDGEHKAYKFLLLRTIPNRPIWNPFPLIISTLNTHIAMINAVSITPNGEMAFCGSFNNICILWDLKRVEIIKILKGHTKYINAVSNTPDGLWAISGSNDNTCIHWDLKAGKPIQFLNGLSKFSNEFNGSISSVIISPDGQKALTGSWDSTCILWNLKTGKKEKTLYKHTDIVSSVSMTPDGQIAISGSYDKTCILWDLKRGEPIQTLEGHIGKVLSVSITPDGKRAISGSEDNTCILWDIKTGKPIQTLRGHSSNVNSVSITPDGKKAISGSDDATCILWNLDTCKPIKSLIGHSTDIKSVFITPDGKRAISGSWDKTCILWDLEKGVSNQPQYSHNAELTAISINYNGEKIISGSWDKTCILWDLKKCRYLQVFKGHTSGVRAVSFTPDGQNFISGAEDKTCIFWNLKLSEPIKTINCPSEILATSITPDGKSAILGLADGTCFLWNLENNKPLQTSHSHKSFVLSIAITPDGKRAVSGSYDKTGILWNLKTGEPIKIYKGYTDSVTSVAISPDGKRAVTGSRVCLIWDLKSATPIQVLNTKSRVTSISITQDGQKTITCSEDGTCILWNLKSGKKLAAFLSNFRVGTVQFCNEGIVLGNHFGELVILGTSKSLLNINIPVVTIRQIWDFELQQYQELSADCPLCGCRFEPPQAIIQTIIQILKDAGIKPDQSPCLELPDEAWEHPGLLGECPECHEKLKFNPFFGSDMNGIENYISSRARENQYQKKFDEAEIAFKEENWENAYSLYLKLVQQGMFDVSYMRYNMAICRINGLSTSSPDLLRDINNLIILLQNEGENDSVQQITDKLNERLSVIRQEVELKRKAEKPWWKKMF